MKMQIDINIMWYAYVIEYYLVLQRNLEFSQMLKELRRCCVEWAGVVLNGAGEAEQITQGCPIECKEQSHHRPSHLSKMKTPLVTGQYDCLRLDYLMSHEVMFFFCINYESIGRDLLFSQGFSVSKFM